MGLVRRVLHYADQKGLTITCDLNFLSFKEERRPFAVLNMQEYRQLTVALLHSRDSKDAGILLTLFTGLRIGELCALTWGQIHLTEGEIFVTRTLQRLQDMNDSAGRRTRIIISPPKEYLLLKDHSASGFSGPLAYVFSVVRRCIFPHRAQR